MKLLDFLKEMIHRFGMKSPKFFRVWQIIFLAATLLTGLPELLTELGVKELPDWAQALSTKTVAIASAVAFVMAKLTVADTAKEVLTYSEKKEVLPFTSKTDK